MYGRIMEPAAVAEQVVNALCSKETIRRIAITPAYAEAIDGDPNRGQKAVETIRGAARD